MPLLVELGTKRPQQAPFEPTKRIDVRIVGCFPKAGRRTLVSLWFDPEGLYSEHFPSSGKRSYHQSGEAHYRSGSSKKFDLGKFTPFDEVSTYVHADTLSAVVNDEDYASRCPRHQRRKGRHVLYFDFDPTAPPYRIEVFLVRPHYYPVPLFADRPATIHTFTETVPWLVVVSYPGYTSKKK